MYLIRAAVCVENSIPLYIQKFWLDMSGKILNPDDGFDGYTVFHMDRKNKKVKYSITVR